MLDSFQKMRFKALLNEEEKSYVKAEMMIWLASICGQVEPQARVVAVQYAAAVFPSDHVLSRYILMLGAGDV